MSKIIVTGATGMIGSEVLRLLLENEHVSEVVSVVRRSSGLQHPKLKELIHPNFLDMKSLQLEFANATAAVYCLGIYTGAADREVFRTVTVDYTKAFADALHAVSPNATFCFLSGRGADTSEKSTLMFAQDKGIAENYLNSLHFGKLVIFRPGYIYPVVKRKEPNLMYSIIRLLYKPVLRVFFPNFSVTSSHLSAAMVHEALHAQESAVLENQDIRMLVKNF